MGRGRALKTPIRLGIDNLLADPTPVAGLRFGLITNPSGVTSRGIPSWKALAQLAEGRLVRLFGPEHGIDGGAVYMEAVGSAMHWASGLPAVSLYGNSIESLKPRRSDIEGLGALVFDIADIGARYYTYAWTMMLAMEACAEAGLRFVVCDRPNPIGGAVEGALQDPDYLSFVGLHPIPVRHGLTVGEMARLLAAERKIAVDLVISPMTGWARDTRFESTGLAWISPSPNIPSPATALVYPGMCLLEGTNLSEGRGTTRPFEVFGAPWLDASAFTLALNARELPGAHFVPVHFRPVFDKHAGKTCGGAFLSVTDPKGFGPFETGIRIVETARKIAPMRFHWRTTPYEFDPRPAIDLLTGSARLREWLDRGRDLAEEIERHRRGALDFVSLREPHLLYPDRKPAVVAFIGAHNAGKTTVVLDLVPLLSGRGLTVGTIKHTSKDVEDDVPGKDSHRHAHSGAAASVLVTPGRTTARRLGTEEELDAVLEREFRGFDIVLVEGYKSLPIPRIEVRRTGITAVSVQEISARVCDEPATDGVPTLRFDDRDGIAATVLRLAGLDRGVRR